MKDKLAEVYKRLQALDINPTRKNIEIILYSLNTLRDVFEEMRDMEEGKDVQADTE